MQSIKNYLKFLYFLFLPDYKEGKDPIFVIGTNRSGTSLLTYLLAENPSLEGLFTGLTAPSKSKYKGHGSGYCESNHIWSWMNSTKNVFSKANVDSSFWCHPKFIKEFYRDEPNSAAEAKALRSSIQFYRKTNKQPLIKDQFNLLRIGLLKKIFPKCKIILVYRDYEDFITSSAHKWFHSLNLEQPRSIGLQWIVGNLIAYYDAHFFKSNFYIVSYNELLTNRAAAAEIMQRLNHFLELEPFTYNLEKIDINHRFKKENYLSPFDFKVFDPIINFESKNKKDHESN